MAAPPNCFDPENFTPQDLEREINRQVYGQELAAKRLSHALWWNRERLNLIKSGVLAESIPAKLNVLFVATTGQGKTAMLKLASRLLGVPFYPTLATSYSSTGYYGQNVDEMVAGLLAAANYDVAKAQRGIIFIDEIDKLNRKKGSEGRLDVSGIGVQQALLGIVEGTTVVVDRGAFKHFFDTSGVTFVGAGACDGLVVPPEHMRQIPGGELVDFGWTPEFVGRFPVRVGLNTLGESGMRRLLVEAESSELKKLQRVFQHKGVELEFTDAWLDAVVRVASKYPTGVRALNEVVTDRCMEVAARLPELAKRPGTKVIVDVTGVRETPGARPALAAPAVPPVKPAPPAEKPPAPNPPPKPEPPKVTPARPPSPPEPPRVRRVEAPPAPPAVPPKSPPAAGTVAPSPGQVAGARQTPSQGEPVAPKRIEPPKSPSVVDVTPPLGPWDSTVEWVYAHPVKIVLAVVVAALLGVAGWRAAKSEGEPATARPPAARETRHRLFPELDSPFEK
jgi:ATP-dependent Clp protease ATP-binding subunit ClpX